MRWVQRLLRSSVVVHLSSGSSIRGILVGEYRDAIVLAHAHYLTAGGAEPIDGEAGIPRATIAWIQQLPSETR